MTKILPKSAAFRSDCTKTWGKLPVFMLGLDEGRTAVLKCKYAKGPPMSDNGDWKSGKASLFRLISIWVVLFHIDIG